jgi:hypothetical protein
VVALSDLETVKALAALREEIAEIFVDNRPRDQFCVSSVADVLDNRRSLDTLNWNGTSIDVVCRLVGHIKTRAPPPITAKRYGDAIVGALGKALKFNRVLRNVDLTSRLFCVRLLLASFFTNVVAVFFFVCRQQIRC